MSDIKGGDLHDLVEQEMASTSQAVEQAADRIEALLNEARKRDSGVSLEVNERYLIDSMLCYRSKTKRSACQLGNYILPFRLIVKTKKIGFHSIWACFSPEFKVKTEKRS